MTTSATVVKTLPVGQRNAVIVEFVVDSGDVATLDIPFTVAGTTDPGTNKAVVVYGLQIPTAASATQFDVASRIEGGSPTTTVLERANIASSGVFKNFEPLTPQFKYISKVGEKLRLQTNAGVVSGTIIVGVV